jgi:hypothetical protein
VKQRASTKKITKWQPTVPTLWLLWQPTVPTLWLLWQPTVPTLWLLWQPKVTSLWLLSSGYYDNPPWLPYGYFTMGYQGNPQRLVYMVTMTTYSNYPTVTTLWLRWQPTVTTLWFTLWLFYLLSGPLPKVSMGEGVLLPCDSRTLKDTLNDLGFFNSCDWMSYRATRPVIQPFLHFLFLLFPFSFPPPPLVGIFRVATCKDLVL